MKPAEMEGWIQKLNASWESQLQEVDKACRRIHGLVSLLLTVHPEPQCKRLVNPQAVISSLRRMVTAAPVVWAEVQGDVAPVSPVLLRCQTRIFEPEVE